MKSVKLSGRSNVWISQYHGPKKHDPLKTDAQVTKAIFAHLTLMGLCKVYRLTNIVLRVNDDEEENCPEWVKYIWLLFDPLIDATPSHPETVLTDIYILLKRLSRTMSEIYLHIEADMQLCQVSNAHPVTNIIRWKNLVVTLGGMDTIMSFMAVLVLNLLM